MKKLWRSVVRLVLTVCLAALCYLHMSTNQKLAFGETLRPQSGNYRIYLPLIMRGPVPETSQPPGRWPYSGEQVRISYRWNGVLTNSNHTWRPAFQSAINDWNNAPTKIDLYFDGGSDNTIDMVYDAGLAQGFTQWTALTNGVMIQAKTFGNLYWDIHWGYTNNQRRSVAAHEIGHVQGVGHIPRSYTVDALMTEWAYLYEMDSIYFPLGVDVMLVNQVYP